MTKYKRHFLFSLRRIKSLTEIKRIWWQSTEREWRSSLAETIRRRLDERERETLTRPLEGRLVWFGRFVQPIWSYIAPPRTDAHLVVYTSPLSLSVML